MNAVNEAEMIIQSKLVEEYMIEQCRPGRFWESLWLSHLGNTLENMPELPYFAK
jgi:hypothetical protein